MQITCPISYLTNSPRKTHTFKLFVFVICAIFCNQVLAIFFFILYVPYHIDFCLPCWLTPPPPPPIRIFRWRWGARVCWPRATTRHANSACAPPCPASSPGKPVLRIRIRRIRMFLGLLDPDPDSLVRGTDPDPAVFGPPRSGSISQRYSSGSDSGFFYHQAKTVRKTLIPFIL
jgi:hypothetical protein